MDTLEQLGLGSFISPKDDRDFKPAMFNHPDISTANSDLPKNFNQQDYSIYNQGGTNKCVAYASKSIVEFFNKQQYGSRIEVSADFIYSNRLETDYNFNVPKGMYPREALKRLQDDGVCEIDLFVPMYTDQDINDSWDAKDITAPRKENAKRYKIGTYIALNDNIDIMRALYRLQCVMMIIPITNKFTGGYNEKLTHAQLDENGLRGSHAVRCIGWKEECGTVYWVCANSWGSEWGNNGIFYIAMDTYIYETWAMSDSTLTHWSDIIFKYLNSIDINIDCKTPDAMCKRGDAFIYLCRGLNYKDNLAYDRAFYYCNANGVKILETNYEAGITRGESFTILAKYINRNKPKPITDVTKPGEHWANKFFDYLNANGIKIYEKRFDDKITHAEFCTLMAKLNGFK